MAARALRRLHPERLTPQLAFRWAVAAHGPAPYAGPMVLFRAARLPLGIEAAPDLGWGGLVPTLGVETVRGYFTAPISEPGVAILAERLASDLGAPAREH